MDKTKFWQIIDSACGSDAARSEEWYSHLRAELKKLPSDEIVEWNHTFDRLADEAYKVDLWGAAYLINGGASDDGFYYFRCWLIGMGRQVFEAALQNPDSLADVAKPDMIAEAEIYAAAHRAWMDVTGNSNLDTYPARKENAALVGEDWDFDDNAEMKQRLPRLAGLFLG